MSEALAAVALLLLLALVAGVARIARGPTQADRMMAAQLFGTTAVAILLLLGAAFDAPALIDVALVVALLAVVAAVAFVRRSWGGGSGP